MKFIAVLLWTQCALVTVAFSPLANSATKNVTAKVDAAAISGFIEAGSRVTKDYATIDLILTKGQAVGDAVLAAGKDLPGARVDFDEKAVPAVHGAGSNDSLAAAVKDYYSAATTCFDAAKHSSITTHALCDTMATKQHALELELKLAQ